MFTCYYDFQKRATCDSYFELHGRTRARFRPDRVRRHPVRTQRHRRHGQVPRRAWRDSRLPCREERRASRVATPELGRDEARPGHPRVAAVAVLAVVVGAMLATAANARRTFTIYAVSTQGQYANHADDRSRGALDNPFNADLPAPTGKGKALAGRRQRSHRLQALQRPLVQEADRLRVTTPARSPRRTSRCARRAFNSNDGSMTASGPTNWDSTAFTLAVSGGTGQLPRRTRPGVVGPLGKGTPPHVRPALSDYGFGTSLRSPFMST